MRILEIHNRYLIRGGEDESFDTEVRMLRDYGHTVEEFVVDNRSAGRLNTPAVALRTIWNPAVRRQAEAVCRHFRPDVAVVQNFFPVISPSVYYGCRAASVPVVQYIRNYRIFCPAAIFFRAGHVCEDCMGWPVALPGVVHRCYRQSLGASLTVAVMSAVHRAMGTWRSAVDRYIAISEFARNKCIEGGLPAERLRVKPNVVHPVPPVGNGADGSVLFVGRLVAEKGVDVLIDAWLSATPPGVLRIVGDGPEEARLKARTTGRADIEWMGRRSSEETGQLMGRASALVFPTLLYETFGRVVIEAYARGTPVIASRIGAVAELVDEGKTGFLVPPGDRAAWADALKRFSSMSAERCAGMRMAARAAYESRYTPARNHAALQEILSELVAGDQAERRSR